MTLPRYRTPSAAAAAATVLTALLATAAQAGAQAGTDERRCAAAVERHLQTRGLDAAEIAQTEYVAVIGNREFGTPREIQAWTALKSCAGSLVTKLTTSCRVKETYARGDCGPPGADRD